MTLGMLWYSRILSWAHVIVVVLSGRPDAGEMTPEVTSFLCYTCTFTWNPLMQTAECIHAPENVTTGTIVTPCKKYCTTQRQYDYDLKAVRSFGRFCGEDTGNICQEEPNFFRQNCYTSCRSDRCNDGNGIPITTTAPPRHVTQNPFRVGEEGKGKDRKNALPKWNADWDKMKSSDCRVQVGIATMMLGILAALGPTADLIVSRL